MKIFYIGFIGFCKKNIFLETEDFLCVLKNVLTFNSLAFSKQMLQFLKIQAVFCKKNKK